MNRPIQRVGVVGAGVIGASWTTLFLAAGLEVDVFDPADDAEKSVRDYIERAWPAMETLGRAAQGNPDALRFHTSAGDAVADMAFIQESVPERLPVKRAIYAEIEPRLAPDAIVATSTSGLMLSELQEGWTDPSRLLLAHPFNPPHLIPLVELYANDRTAAGILETAETFYDSLGKVTIRLQREVPGHVANRLQAALWREAIHLAVTGVASVGDIDKAISCLSGKNSRDRCRQRLAVFFDGFQNVEDQRISLVFDFGDAVPLPFFGNAVGEFLYDIFSDLRCAQIRPPAMEAFPESVAECTNAAFASRQTE